MIDKQLLHFSSRSRKTLRDLAGARCQTPGNIWGLWDFFGFEIAAYNLADEEKELPLC